MTRIKIDQEALGLSSLIEKKAHVKIMDLFKDNDTIYVVVNPGEMGKILGKGGETVRRMQQQLGKRIKAIEFADSVVSFIKNIISPITVEQILETNGEIHLKDSQKKTKSLLIGRDGRKLKLINRAVNRFYKANVKVI